MRTHPNILVNPAAGQRTEILRRADQLEDRIDLRVGIEHVGGGGGPPHVHPNQTEHFHVLHGKLRVILGDQELLLGRGEEATVPPGTVHTFSAAEDDTEFDVRVSPALRIEAALEDGYELFDRGLYALQCLTVGERGWSLQIERPIVDRAANNRTPQPLSRGCSQPGI